MALVSSAGFGLPGLGACSASFWLLPDGASRLVNPTLGQISLLLSLYCFDVPDQLDGYNDDFSDIALHETVRVTGLLSENGGGHNSNAHAQHPDDVVKLAPVLNVIKPSPCRLWSSR